MVDQSDADNSSINRRGYLGAIAGLTATPLVGSIAGASHDEVIYVDDAGADNDGNESVHSVLNSVADDGVTLRFSPDGTYKMDGTMRVTGYDDFAMEGNGATIDVKPTDGYVFKCGTYRSPINNLRVEDFTIDLSDDGAAGRAFECQANDNLEVNNITVEGEHDGSGKGPMLVGLRSDSGTGYVSNVSMPDGGEDVSGGYGGTGMFVSHYHQGTVFVKDCYIGAFPDNGLYCSNSDGNVHVEGGHFENCNVAGVRLNGDNCSLKGATFEYDEDIPGFDGQRPVRCDGGSIEISDVDIEMSIDQTESIRVMSGADSVTIEDCSMDLNGVRDAVSVVEGAGSVNVDDITVNGNIRELVYHY